ncbi:PAS domain S-box protein [Desulfoferrobacter suflitae]|uniref:PAS domain S-box protein n=1 Tax=Desulfoferrobacter suflitae TaxID=2865782 RepID=UPI002164CE12|nr:PAS domain S-box protein [Desulfoferrobacter suflitae]MCK8600944.1 PAS domain S-box protein [Desulfoferrobacter suflitae]
MPHKIIMMIYHSLILRLILLVGLVLFISISTWSYFNIKYQKQNSLNNIVLEVERLGNTIRLGTHYAMMLNSREDINEIIKNIGRQKGIENIRIFNKEGQIKFSNVPTEVDQTTNIKADACYICHRTDPPREKVDISQRTRIFAAPEAGYRLLGLISPIYNEPSCTTDVCHVHPGDKKVLGALDVVVSLAATDEEIQSYERWILVLAVISFLAASAIIGTFLWMFVNRPINKLITCTRLIGQGEYDHQMETGWEGEIGQLAIAISQMGKKISEKQEELNKQRYEYQELFEQVPCFITVQDRNLRILRYNREFTRHFEANPGDYCYEVYKNRSEPCEVCPVMMTFADGQAHSSEESGITKDGKVSHWIAWSSPIRDVSGEITAVMEVSLDITGMKRLEEEIRKSEQKYRDIFNNIPNPIFVLDRRNLIILDCNDVVKSVYGFDKQELVKNSFLMLFEESEHQNYALDIRNSDALSQVRQLTKDGRLIYANVRISPSEYMGREALLVTTSDITKRLLAEQQLIQASKMATLGEMATGIAHELNQPLSVIKTASSFLIKKVVRGQKIKEEILKTMAEEIDSHVDRASNIINHLREFGRKSEVKKEAVQINEPLKKAMEIFSQQLKLREIEIVTQFDENLPAVLANSNRLEQVFINLLINARDAIEEKVDKSFSKDVVKRIILRTFYESGKVTVSVKDSGPGIPDSVLDKIFEPFFTTKKVGKGTGLGLSISYGIVQDYDGTIRVKTTEDEGSEFIIQLPVASEV